MGYFQFLGQRGGGEKFRTRRERGQKTFDR